MTLELDDLKKTKKDLIKKKQVTIENTKIGTDFNSLVCSSKILFQL